MCRHSRGIEENTTVPLVSGRGDVSFDGQGNFPGDEGTVEFWLRPGWDGNNGATQSVFGASGGEMNYLNINKLPTDRFGAGMSGKPAAKDFVYRRADAPVKDWRAGQWHHLAVCWKGDRLALWIDGQCAARSSGVVPPQSPPVHLIK